MTYVTPISMPLKGTKSKHFSRNTRFTRQVNSINSYKNNKGDTAERYIKILLDLQPENEEDVYDYYDNQEKHISGLMEDRTLNKEIENNSKLLTRNLSESQERKRCTKNNMENLGPRKLQLSQPLTLENIEDKKKSNMDWAELRNNYNRNLGLKKNNDDYYINILNQLIDKLNKSKDSKSTNNKDLLARKSNEPVSLENKSDEDRTTNSSSEEELILRLEKIKGNRIIDKLNSSPETTFVNGKWVRNKIQENKHSDLKPIDLRSEFNYTDEPISINDLKQLNLTYPEYQFIDTKGDIIDNFNNLQVFGTQENKEISTSPLPEENEHLLVSRATVTPIYLTSTIEDKLDSIMVDENDTLQFMTNHTDEFNNENNDTNHEQLYGSPLNNFHTTPKYEPNKDLPFDMNNILKTKNPERILESNVNENNNSPKSNYSEEVTTDENLSLANKENDSSENNGYCNCNKKVVKNILSSTTIQNITEIKTNSYASPNNLKTSSHKRSDKLQKTNNVTSNGVSNENKKDLVSNLLLKNQITDEKPTKRKLIEPKVNTLPKSTLDIDDKINKNMKTVTNTFLQNYKTPRSKIQQLQLNGQKKRNSEEKNEKVIKIQKNKVSVTPKNLQNKNPRQLAVPSKQFISKNDDYVRSNTEEYYDIDDVTENKRASTLSKNSKKIPNKITSRIPFQGLPGSFKENINHENVLINLKDQNIPKNSGGYHNIDDVTTPKKASNSPKSLSLIPTKINNRSSPTLMSKYLEKVQDSDANAAKHIPRKLITELHTYAPFNQNPYVGNTQRKNINNDSSKNAKIVNGLDFDKSRKPLNLVENNGRTNIINIPKLPKYRYNDNENVYSTDTPEYSDKRNIEISKKISKVLPPLGSRPIKNNENSSILKLKKPLIDAKTKFSLAPPVRNKKIPIINNRPFLKKQNTVTNQLPTQSLFVRKTDPTKNSTLLYDPDLKFKPKVSKISPEDSSIDEDAKHAPYKYEDLEPIIFDRPAHKPGSTNKNSESVFRKSPGWQSARENQLQNTQGFEPSRSVSTVRPEYDDYNDDTRRSDGGEANVKKHTGQSDTSNNGPANDDNTGDDGHSARDSRERPANQSGFEVLHRIKLDDGMFKIPLVGHKDFDKNGSAYISDIYVPIEQSNGEHTALSLSELLTGDFRYVNERHPTVEHTLEAGPPLSSTRIPKDRTSADVADQSCDPTVSRAVEPSDGKETAPIHIIQIVNNGQCPNKHAGNDAVKKSEQNDKVSSRRFRNGGQRVSVARSKDTVGNGRPIEKNQKFENAYDHFDSDILDRFLQVYAPPTV